jgi:O-antigen/teichoic acid export membrane protein
VTAPWLASAYDEPALTWPLRAIALALFGHSVMSLFRGIFVALGRNSIDLRLVTSESAVETGASIGLVLLGAGAAGAAFGRAIGYGVGAALGVLLVRSLLGPQAVAFREFRWSRARPLARYAGALGVVEGSWKAFGHVDALVVGGFLQSAAVGIYQAPMRLILFLQQPSTAVANAVVPRLARSGDEQPAVVQFVQALRYVIVFQALLVPPLVVWADPITALLLGPEYEESANVLRALTPFVFLSGIATLLSLAANFLGEARRRVPIALATLALDVVLALALVPTVGVVGAAIATSIAYLGYTVGHLWICLRILPLPLRPLLLTTARAAAAAAAAGAVLAALGTGDLAVLEWALGAAVAPAAFLLTLAATRELRGRDVAELRALVARARG